MKKLNNEKEKELFNYLNGKYREDKKEPIAIMVHNTKNDIITTAHGDNIRNKNFLVAGILCRVVANLLIEAGFDNTDDLGTAYAMLEAYNTPIEKLKDFEEFMK